METRLRLYAQRPMTKDQRPKAKGLRPKATTGCYNQPIMKDKKNNQDVDETEQKDSASGDKQKRRISADDDPESDASEGGLKPVRPRIGESENNLQQRADWFQKRSGKR